MIYVMQIVNTHGVRGEVKALHYTDGDTFFKKVKTVYKEDNTPVKILSWKFHKGSVILKLDGVDELNDAEKLKFTKLYAREEDLPKLPKGEYYFFELIGLTAILPDGEELGKVTDVIENNASNLLQITKTGGEKVLIPNIPVFVSDVKIKDGTIHITPIEGLI
ncbi:MAG: 16S rRNA processing protein RimM [Clostridia bacterium]|nr:16S rRNA processing protein RimM [Clostridia bacterium]